MPSSQSSASASAARSLLMLVMAAASVKAGLPSMTYSGCYSSSKPLEDQGPYTYQTTGYCQPICVKANNAVLGLSGGSDCWCGNELPPASSKVDDSKCNTPCDGYDKDMCGGQGFYSVYLTGLEANVAHVAGSSDGDTSSASTPSSTSAPSASKTNVQNAHTAASEAPSVVTSIAPGTTVVQTVAGTGQQAESTSGASPTAKSSGKGTSVVGVAVGVVVGVLALIAIIVGVFFLLKRRRDRAAIDHHNRQTQTSEFMRGGAQRPPMTAYSEMSDSRLDPEANNRRNSVGSIADDQDYSRKILRVANPS